MQIIQRAIAIETNCTISSVWARPESYRPGKDGALILAHGAGNGMDHPFLSHVHLALAEAGLLTVKFNFPYMESGRKAPDRAPLLEKTFRSVIEAVRSDPELAPGHLYLGGKSMGGRIATLAAAHGETCRGLVMLGYPLHPAGKQAKLRVEHWPKIPCPLLFIQGSRDALCDPELLKAELVRLSVRVELHEIPGGDHSFKLPKAMGRSEEEVWDEIVATLRHWLAESD
ncbi:MAG: dienelactone hydrolase family protein [Methylococcaceae bacterium]|nr:dienelactone hydrolase family protein [Methylococcaceae bacterium]